MPCKVNSVEFCCLTFPDEASLWSHSFTGNSECSDLSSVLVSQHHLYFVNSGRLSNAMNSVLAMNTPVLMLQPLTTLIDSSIAIRIQLSL